MKRILIKSALVMLILAVAGAAGLWWYVRPHEQVIYSDGGAINQPAASGRVREILWEPPVKLAQQINIPTDVYEPCLSSDGLTLYFVRGRAGKNADIYVCTRTQTGWTEAIPLAAINSPHDELGPHLAPNGRELYFYSDRPGTLGGHDLWVSRSEADKWQTPVNLGVSINSAANEYGPAISPDGKVLIFASNRPKADEDVPPATAWSATIREDLTRRDYDLYVVALTTTSAKSEPLARLNTLANEGAAAFSPFGDFLYFSSDRPGGDGGFDLYRSRCLRGELGEPETLGAQVNTNANELDPALGLGGYGLHFSSDRPEGQSAKREYQLYYTASREVFRDIHIQRAVIDWQGLWSAIAPNLFWGLLALLLMLLLLTLLRDIKGRRLSLLTKCLLASLLLHTMLMLLFNVWQVGASVAQAIRKGPIRVGLHSGAQGGLAAQIRGSITSVDVSVPGTPSLTQGEAKLALRPLRAMSRLPTAPTKVELRPASIHPIKISDALPVNRIVSAPPPPAPAPGTHFDIALPTETNQVATAESNPQVPLSIPGASRGMPVAAMSTAPIISPKMEVARSSVDSVGPTMPSSIMGVPSDAQMLPTSHSGGSAPRVSTEQSHFAITLPAMPDQSPQGGPTEESFGDARTSIGELAAGSVARSGIQPAIGSASSYMVTTAPASTADSSFALGNSLTAAIVMTDAPLRTAGTGTVPSHTSISTEGGSGASSGASAFDGIDLGRMEESPAAGGVEEQFVAASQGASPGPLQRAIGVYSSIDQSGGAVGTGGTSVHLPPLKSSGIGGAEGTPGIGSEGVAQADAPTNVLPSLSASAPISGLHAPQISIGLPTEQLPPENPYVQRSPEQRTPLLQQMGGNDETEKAVADALAWLAAHQSSDGRWSSEGFDRGCRACGGAASADVDVAVTGLALLCFLGADHTHLKDGPYKEAVRRGLNYLRRIQEENGDLRNDESMYSHGIAAICLAEAYGMTKDKLLHKPVERAVDFIYKARNKRSGGWRYDPGQAGDTSVLGWQIMALKSAERGGIAVPDDAFEVGRHWMAKVNSRSRPGLFAYQPGRKATAAMTAEGMFVQSLLGVSRDDTQMQSAAEYLLESPPTWNETNTYYWYYATLALFQHQGDQWHKWNDQLVPQLLAHQEKMGRAAGSWPPVGQWAPTAGRVYQTALCGLMLEVYYRYLPMYSQPSEVASP